MRAIQGALIIASTIQIILGFSGLWRNVARFLSPLSAVPLVALAGFGLYEFGFPGVSIYIYTHMIYIATYTVTDISEFGFLFLGCQVC